MTVTMDRFAVKHAYIIYYIGRNILTFRHTYDCFKHALILFYFANIKGVPNINYNLN